MNPSIRHKACDILNTVATGQAFADDLIVGHLESHGLSQTPDGRLLTHLVYGVLRHRAHLDWILAGFYKGNYDRMDESVKNILRVGLYQLKFSDRLPAFAVVDEAVKIAKKIAPAAAGLTNAILRNYLRGAGDIAFPAPEAGLARHLSIVHSHPLWLVRRWIDEMGQEETLALCRSSNEQPPLTIRANTLKTTTQALARSLEDSGFASEPTRFSPCGLVLKDPSGPIQKSSFFLDGFLRIQDEGAQLISHLVAPGAGQSVLDACAGSGGKTTHLAALMQNRGYLLALDKNATKNKELQKDALRLGISIIESCLFDLNQSLPSDLVSRFDHVLLDAPCSGTGTLRRNPEIKWRLDPLDPERMAKVQSRLLACAADAVKPGGRLVYATCSLLSVENERVVDRFLTEHAGFTVSDKPANLDPTLWDSRGFLRTYPHHHQSDGFFAACLARRI